MSNIVNELPLAIPAVKTTDYIMGSRTGSSTNDVKISMKSIQDLVIEASSILINTKADFAMVSNINNTLDTEKPVSVLQQTALNLKSDKLSTFSKTEVLSMVSNVDNTSDSEKPISVLQQTALNLKSDKLNTFSKTEVLDMVSNVDNTSDSEKPVSVLQQTALSLKSDKLSTYSKTETLAAISETRNFTVNSIMPDMTGASGSMSTRDIGDANHRFANVWANDVHVGAASLFVNGKQVISDVSETMTFSTEEDRSINIKTTGIGSTAIISDNQISATAKGGLEFKVPSDTPSKNINFTNQSVGGLISFSSLETIAMNAPVATKDLTVVGNLTVTGTTTQVNTEQLLIADNIVTLNKNQTGTPPTSLVSGIEVERGDELNYRIVFEELSDSFKCGMQGSMQSIATREDSPINGGVVTWDTATFKLVTETKKTSFNKDFGNTSGSVSEGNHLHTGVYEPPITKATGFNLATGTTTGTLALGNHLHTGVYATSAQGTKADAALPSASYTQADVVSKVQGMNFSTAPTIVSKKIVTVTSAIAFPTSPAPSLGDMCYRTDLDELYFHQGLTWIQL